MQKRQQQQHNDSLLQEEQETDQALPQTDNEENSPKQSKKKNEFRYTIAAPNEQDISNILTNECAICCFELVEGEQKKLYRTPCNHVFHEDCLKDWGFNKLECPTCRSKLPRFTNPYN